MPRFTNGQIQPLFKKPLKFSDEHKQGTQYLMLDSCVFLFVTQNILDLYKYILSHH